MSQKATQEKDTSDSYPYFPLMRQLIATSIFIEDLEGLLFVRE